jgi:hypothetical protein
MTLKQLRQLADDRQLPAGLEVNEELVEILHEWYLLGYCSFPEGMQYAQRE